MTTDTAVTELQGVRLAFDKEEVLAGVDLSIAARERLVILGILKPNCGSVQFKGMEVTRMGRRRLNRMRQRIGMVYQYSALISS